MTLNFDRIFGPYLVQDILNKGNHRLEVFVDMLSQHVITDIPTTVGVNGASRSQRNLSLHLHLSHAHTRKIPVYPVLNRYDPNEHIITVLAFCIFEILSLS
jgi:hypothetical protein